MSTAAPFFFKEPLRYLRWASVNKPAYFYSICVGLAGPGTIAVVVPTRKYLGYERISKVPQTYPSTCAKEQKKAMTGRRANWVQYQRDQDRDRLDLRTSKLRTVELGCIEDKNSRISRGYGVDEVCLLDG